MKYYDSIEKVYIKGKSAVCIGKFEAIHKAHQNIIKQACNKKKDGYEVVVLTFNNKEKKLFTLEERKIIFERLGVDVLINIDIEEIKNIEAEYFIQDVLIKKLNIGYISCGQNFRFGKYRLGNTELLKEMSYMYGYDICINMMDKVEDTDISSSLIKEAFLSGDMEKVNSMLEHTYFLYGKVVLGNQIGRKIGVPTANIEWPKDKLLPPKGVYAVKTYIDNKRYYGIANIGTKPTIENNADPLIEVHIFDFEKDIYDKFITVHMFKFMRAEQKFEGIDKLKKVLEKDIENIKIYFANEHSNYSND